MGKKISNAVTERLKLRGTIICLDCEALFFRRLGYTCPVCGGAATWLLTAWIPAMQGMDMVTMQHCRQAGEVA